MTRRLLYFSREYTTHDRRFLEALSASPTHAAPDWEVHFLRLERDGVTYEPRPLPEGVIAVDWAGGTGAVSGLHECLDLLPAYQEVIDRLRPDVVQAGPIQSCAFMAVVTGGAPVLAVSWGSDILVDAPQDPLSRWVTRKALEGADAFLCDSRSVLEAARGYAPIPDADVVIFPWGIDLAAFTPGTPEERAEATRARSRLGWGDQRVVLSTRAWESLHGVETLLEGFAGAHRRDPSLRLLLAGTGSRRDWVEAFLARESLGSVVHAPGQISQERVPGLFRMADLYVSCAHSDGSSISLIEALATGLPVVVTDIPSNREWVTGGENGWLTAPGDGAALTDALLEGIALSPAERERIERANRAVAEERADWFRNVEGLRRTLDRLAVSGLPGSDQAGSGLPGSGSAGSGPSGEGAE